MFQDLTLQQFCALDYNRNMVVTSGPGAGKTRILSHRFCFILLTDDSVTIPQILTLTFTEKAAEEMKSRIYGMLQSLETDPVVRGNVVLLPKIRKAKQQFHKNRISTIHAFCASLLRENPVESGTDPGFAVIQGARKKGLMDLSIDAGVSSVWRFDKDMLMPLLHSFGGRNNLKRALGNVIEHPLTFKRIMDSKEELFQKKGWTGRVFRDYCRLIKDKEIIAYLKGLRKAGNGKGQYDDLLSLLEEWHRHAEDEQECFGIPQLFHNLRRLVDDRTPFSPTLTINEGKQKISYVDLVENYYPDIFEHASPDSIFEEELNLFMKVAKVCADHYQEEKKKIMALDFADLEARAYSFLMGLHKNDEHGHLKRIGQRFRYIMVDEFQDTNIVQWDIIRLLCTNNKGEGREFIAPGKLFVVGDKRQAIYGFRGGDVTVFESVIKEIKESNPAPPPEMFWQNGEMCESIRKIYSEYPESMKRQAELFDALPDSERKDILKGDIYLPHNFRTDPRPIEFFNKIFKEIFSNKNAGKVEKYETAPRVISLPDNERRLLSYEGSVSIYLSTPLAGEKGNADIEAALIANIIEGILGKRGKDCNEFISYPDIREKIEENRPAIGVLFFRFSHLKIFENAFREAGLPFVVHRGRGFYRCQEVMEMLQLLNHLIDEREQISLLSALRSPIFGLTDPEIFDLFYKSVVTLNHLLNSERAYVRFIGRQIKSWRTLSCHMTIGELIRRIIVDRSLTAVYSVHPNGMQKMANIEKLVELGRRFQSDGNGSLSEFVKYCLDMADQEEEEGEASLISGEESPITLMTIHAAKGLEFPMVIIPDLDRRPPARSKTGRPVRLYSSGEEGHGAWNDNEGEIPVWQVEIPELDYLRKYGPLGHLLTRRKRLEEIAESRRVFYVGCTRARNHLILVSGMKKGLMQREGLSLTSEDYKERATLLELLDDIYGFYQNFPPEQSKFYECSREMPSVIWRDPEPTKLRGNRYGNVELGLKDFGAYGEKIKSLDDLTGPIRSTPYFQLSFKAVRIFKKCPVRFYYNVILGIKLDGSDASGIEAGAEFYESTGLRENDEVDGSGYSLFLGTLIHKYLEKHNFGDPLDENLLNNLWEQLVNHEMMNGYDFEDNTFLNVREKAFGQLKKTVNDTNLISLLERGISHAEVPFLFTTRQGIEFRGVIDRLFRDEDNGDWKIIDWKSNDLTEKDPVGVATKNDYYLQLACYKWAVESILKEDVKGLYIYFTDVGHLLESDWKADPEDIIKEMLEKINVYEENREQLLKDIKKMRTRSGECRSCEYREAFCGGQ